MASLLQSGPRPRLCGGRVGRRDIRRPSKVGNEILWSENDPDLGPSIYDSLPFALGNLPALLPVPDLLFVLVMQGSGERLSALRPRISGPAVYDSRGLIFIVVHGSV